MINSRLIDTYCFDAIVINNGEIELNYRLEIFETLGANKTYEAKLLRGEFFSVRDTFQEDGFSDEYFYVEDHEVDYVLSNVSDHEVVVSGVIKAIQKYIKKLTNKWRVGLSYNHTLTATASSEVNKKTGLLQ